LHVLHHHAPVLADELDVAAVQLLEQAVFAREVFGRDAVLAVAAFFVG